jgi:hypothetical protein
MAEAMTPFVDLHVLRDGTHEFTLYGDDGEAIPDPDDATLRAALYRVDNVVCELLGELDDRRRR